MSARSEVRQCLWGLMPASKEGEEMRYLPHMPSFKTQDSPSSRQARHSAPSEWH